MFFSDQGSQRGSQPTRVVSLSAALTAVLWQGGERGEAESHWAAASGLDPRYRQEEWLLQIRRWPPRAVQALQHFLSLTA